MDVAKPKVASNRNSLYWIGIPLALFILISAVCIWIGLKQNEFTHLSRQLHDASALVVNPLENTVETYAKSLIRMGKRWDADTKKSIVLWHEDALNFYNDMEVFEAIGRVDNQMRILDAVPDSKKFEGINLSSLPKTEQPTLSGIIHLTDGSKGFLIIVPLHVNKKSDGAIIASVNVARLMRQIFESGLNENYGISIYQNETPVFMTGSTTAKSLIVKEQKINLFNTRWTHQIWATDHLLNKLKTGLPHVVLAGGIMAAIAVLIIFYFHSQLRTSFLKTIQAKRESENIAARMQKIIETVHEGFLSFDERGILIDWNPYAEKMLGWSKQEALGKKVYDLVIPSRNRINHKNVIDHYIQTNNVEAFNKEIEFSAIKRDGTEFPVEVVILPLHLNGLYTFHAFIRDITIRKKLESDQARLTSIIDSSDDAILSSDLNAIIMTWNRGAEKLYGYKAEEIIGKSVSIIYPNENKADLVDNLMKVKSGEHIQNHNTTRVDKNGRIIPVSVAITPILGRTGRITGISSITRDMTERNKIEKMKNEFISIVSHELRTPLTSIKGSLGLLYSEKVCDMSDNGKRLIEIANNNCDRLMRLINDILDIEKIEAGKMEFKFENLNLNKLIREAIESNYQFAEKYNVNIDFISEEEFIIKGDYDRLSQVMTNLLSNAILHSPQNETVKIKLARSEGKVRVSVIDNGQGIPLDFQDKIFGKFSQADSSSERKIGGTGLGLNISKAIIEKHGGLISFISSYGRGATFYFEIPIDV